MRMWLVACVVCLTASARAGHVYVPRDVDDQLRRLRAMVCKPRGATLLTIEHVAIDAGETVPLWTLAIYNSGAWQRTVWTAAGPRVLGACLNSRSMNFVYDHLRAMTWRTTGAPRCTLALPVQTTDRARGKQRHVATPCGPALDDDSAQQLAEIEAVVEAARQKVVQ